MDEMDDLEMVEYEDDQCIPDEHCEPREAYFYRVFKKLDSLYVGYRQRYALMVPGPHFYIPKDRKTGKPFPLTNHVLFRHLNQDYAVAVFAGEYATKFLCFDVDDGNKETVRRIVQCMVDLGLPKECMAVSTSGGKGFHVELFFAEFAYLNHTKQLYDYVVHKLELDAHKVEFRPTSGQSIKIPLSVNFKTGNICWYLDMETLEPIESWDAVLGIQQMEEAAFLEVLQKLPKPSLIVQHPVPCAHPAPVAPPPETFYGVPMIEVPYKDVSAYGPKLTEPGKCFLTMRGIAIRERNEGNLSESKLRHDLEEWVRQQNPAFITDTDAELKRNIDNLVDWVFSDKFHIKHPVSRTVVLNQEDIALCLAQKSRVWRRLMFVIVCYTKKFGQAKVSQKTLAKRAGAAERRVRDGLCDFIDNGYLTCEKGYRTFVGSGYVQNVNIYRPVYGRVDVSHYSFRKDSYTLPNILASAETAGNPKWFVELYYKVMAEMIEPASLSSLFSRSEVKIIKEILKDG